MAENENTFTAYLGSDFQERLMWQLLVEPEFAEKTIPKLSVDYFDDPNYKRLFIIILEYLDEYDKVPNLQNTSIHQAINQYKTSNNTIEEEALLGLIKRIELWNESIINKEMLHNGDAIQKATNQFIKQQEYRKLGEYILEKTKTGEIKNKYTLGHIEDKITLIGHIGDEEDYGTEVIENIHNALRKEFRQTIPTGVSVIDTLTGGGLGRSEIGLILTPSGVGKTTLLTKIANTGYELGKNVLQIIFEDTVEQIQRKHFTVWSGVKLSEIDDNNEIVIDRVKEKTIKLKKDGGHLVIKRFSQEDTTMRDIRNWIIRYQKKWGYKFDLVVLDYLDCLDSHKKTYDRNEAELVIIKSFEAMAGDFNIPCWSAIQSNRSGFDSEFVEAHQTGGSIKRIQKAHFFMSVAKTPEQKEGNLANIRIIKARFAQDGQTFRDCIFNNDTMEIIIEDNRYANTKTYKKLPHHDTEDINKLDEARKNLQNKSSDLPLHKAINEKLPNVDKDGNEEPSELVKSMFPEHVKPNKSFDAVSEGENEGINDDISEGERLKIEGEVAKVGVDNIEKKIKKPEPIEVNIDDLESMLDDPEEVENENNDVKTILREKSKSQNVINKQ